MLRNLNPQFDLQIIAQLYAIASNTLILLLTFTIQLYCAGLRESGAVTLSLFYGNPSVAIWLVFSGASCLGSESV